eukprot:825761-Pelagomonas_calceolata.AAC.4
MGNRLAGAHTRKGDKITLRAANGYEETPKKKSSKLDGFKDSAAAFGNKTLSGAKSLASGGIEIGMPPPVRATTISSYNVYHK